MSNSRGMGLATAFLAALSLLSASCMDEIGLGGEELENPPGSLSGHAWLENQANHGGIKIDLGEAGVSLMTDEQGNFSLPADLSDGVWTLTARYPYFAEASQEVDIIDGSPDVGVQDMTLGQEIVFAVYTDKEEYMEGDTVVITLEATNISDHEVTLGSPTSPATAYAVRLNNKTMVGGLFPGAGTEPESLTLEPGGSEQFEMTWEILELDPTDMSLGKIEIFGAYCTGSTHPEYFDPQAAPELNESLFSKLSPAYISIEYEHLPAN